MSLDFDDLMSRRVAVRVFGPGALWRRMGNNETLRQIFGDDFPAFFVALPTEPPEMGPGTQYEMRVDHFGAHAFISFRASYRNLEWFGEIKGVAAFCMLDGDIREAALHLIETTRDANGELGGLPARFRFGAAKVPQVRGFVTSGVLEIDVHRLVEAYILWKVTRPEDREALSDPRCPLCAVRPATAVFP